MWALHGLTVAGSVPIHGAAAAAPESRADLVVRTLPPGPLPTGPPPGRPVAALDVAGARYDAALDGERLRIRFHGTASFDVDLSSGAVEARAAPGREGMVEVLLAGNVIALVLGLRGEPVLHAGAVVAADACSAIVGPSGAGKSTLAQLLCAAGMRLLTDDTARVGEVDGAAAIHRGSGEVRLRGPAAEAVAAVELRETADGRTAVRLPAAAEALVPVGRIIVPTWSEEAAGPRAEPLGGRDALSALLRSPRVAGWIAPKPLRVNFECSAALAAAVPALRLTVPRGGLDDPALPERLAAALAGAGGAGG